MGNHVDAARLLDAGDVSGAVAAIESVLANPPVERELADALVVAGRIYLAASQPERAEGFLRDSVELCGKLGVDGPRAWYFLGLSLRRQNRFREAADAYRRSAQDAADVPNVQLYALQNGAAAAVMAGDMTVARELLNQAAPLCKTDDDKLHQQIETARLHLMTGDIKEALRVAGALVSKPGLPDAVAEQANQLYTQARARIA